VRLRGRQAVGNSLCDLRVAMQQSDINAGVGCCIMYLGTRWRSCRVLLHSSFFSHGPPVPTISPPPLPGVDWLVPLDRAPCSLSFKQLHHDINVKKRPRSGEWNKAWSGKYEVERCVQVAVLNGSFELWLGLCRHRPFALASKSGSQLRQPWYSQPWETSHRQLAHHGQDSADNYNSVA